VLCVIQKGYMFNLSTCYVLGYLCRVMIDSRHSCLEDTVPSIPCLMTFLLWSLESCPVLGPSLFLLLLHTTNSITRASDLPVCIVITLLFLLGELMLWSFRNCKQCRETCFLNITCPLCIGNGTTPWTPRATMTFPENAANTTTERYGRSQGRDDVDVLS